MQTLVLSSPVVALGVAKDVLRTYIIFTQAASFGDRSSSSSSNSCNSMLYVEASEHQCRKYTRRIHMSSKHDEEKWQQTRSEFADHVHTHCDALRFTVAHIVGSEL